MVIPRGGWNGGATYQIASSERFVTIFGQSTASAINAGEGRCDRAPHRASGVWHDCLHLLLSSATWLSIPGAMFAFGAPSIATARRGQFAKNAPVECNRRGNGAPIPPRRVGVLFRGICPRHAVNGLEPGCACQPSTLASAVAHECRRQHDSQELCTPRSGALFHCCRAAIFTRCYGLASDARFAKHTGMAKLDRVFGFRLACLFRI